MQMFYIYMGRIFFPCDFFLESFSLPCDQMNILVGFVISCKCILSKNASQAKELIRCYVGENKAENKT